MLAGRDVHFDQHCPAAWAPAFLSPAPCSSRFRATGAERGGSEHRCIRRRDRCRVCCAAPARVEGPSGARIRPMCGAAVPPASCTLLLAVRRQPHDARCAWALGRSVSTDACDAEDRGRACRAAPVRGRGLSTGPCCRPPRGEDAPPATQRSLAKTPLRSRELLAVLNFQKNSVPTKMSSNSLYYSKKRSW